MKPIFTFMALGLVAVIGFGVGLKAGRKHGASTPASESFVGKTLLASNDPPATEAANDASITGRHTTLAEIERALVELSERPRLLEIVKGVDPADIPLVMAMVEKLEPLLRNSIRTELLAVWARTDARAALEFAEAITDSNVRRQALLGVLRGWLSHDPRGALNWVQRLPQDQLRFGVIDVLFSTLAGDQPELMLEFLESNPRRAFSFNDYGRMFAAWAAKAPAAAAARAAAISNWMQRQEAYASIARQ